MEDLIVFQFVYRRLLKTFKQNDTKKNNCSFNSNHNYNKLLSQRLFKRIIRTLRVKQTFKNDLQHQKDNSYRSNFRASRTRNRQKNKSGENIYLFAGCCAYIANFCADVALTNDQHVYHVLVSFSNNLSLFILFNERDRLNLHQIQSPTF